MKVQPDNQAALEFRHRWAPNDLFIVTAIQLDRKKIETKTFKANPEDDAAFLEWLEKWNGKRNIYFHVNPVLGELKKKAEREDIRCMAWLHVDIDPRAGENLEEEQERALALLTNRLPENIPRPTVIIFSGGGYQGFWKLREPVAIDGNLAKAEDAKRYNQQLEIIFGADNCHNIDRIMRLPGTLNVPDEKKQKKGRKLTLATLVEWQDEHIWPIENFIPAPLVQIQGERGFGAISSDITGNIKRLSGVNDLDEWGVDDRLKIVIVQGKNPLEKKAGDDSRSAWLFDCVCNLKRRGVPDDIVFSVITDPEFGISESVLELGANATKYALRQIERASEEIVNPWLRKLNEEFAVISNMGGKCRIIEEVYDHSLGRPRLTRQSFEDFRNRLMHITIEAGHNQKGQPILKPVGRWWLEQPQRRQYKTIVFAPGHELAGTYNMWKGYAFQSKPGDCSLFLDHVKDNVCSGSDTLYQYLFNWMARCIQKPDTPGQVAVVLRGEQGVGKSVFAKVFGSLLGRHFCHISNPSHLVGNFNSHLRDIVVLFADEAFYAGDRRHVSILKTLITEETITIEAKGIDAETAPNFVHLIMASNDAHVIPAGADERRFLMLEVKPAHKRDSEYFGTLLKQMENGGSEALLYLLLNHNLKGYDVRDVPSTKALQDQKMYSLRPEEDWWYNKLQEGQLLQSGQTWPEEVAKEELLQDYIEYTERFKITRRGSATSLGKFLNRVCPGIKSYQRIGEFLNYNGNDRAHEMVRRRAYFFKIPSLSEARAAWEQIYGGGEWPEEQPVEQQ